MFHPFEVCSCRMDSRYISVSSSLCLCTRQTKPQAQSRKSFTKSTYSPTMPYTIYDPIMSDTSYSVLTSPPPFTCRGLFEMFGNPLPAYDYQDEDCLGLEESPDPYLQQISKHGYDFDIIACAFHHFKIEQEWKHAVIAIALQELHSIFRFEMPRDRKYRVEYDQQPQRFILKGDVSRVVRYARFIPLMNQIWAYWAHYDPATKTSTEPHRRQTPPDIETLEAIFKAAIYHSWRPHAREWVCTDLLETYPGGYMQFPPVPFY